VRSDPVPPIPPVYLPRPRLHELLEAGYTGPVTTIVGPAGYGKTVLAASWLGERAPGGPVAWVSLDPADNQPARFWSHLLDALRRCLPGWAAPDRPGRALVPDRRLLASLGAALAALPAPVVLVLDRTEVVTNRVLVAGFQRFLRYATPGLRLIAVGRRAGLLPAHLYRLAGELTEIGTEALALRPDETAELLHRYRVGWTDARAAALHEETEGWVTGVCLHATGGGRAAVSEYLRAEVLHRQPARSQSLLLRTCVLDEVVPAVADRLAGRYDSRAILDELVREHAFVQPVGDAGYRYGPLFRAALQDEVTTRFPGLLRRLHRTAAAWFDEHDRIPQALHHLAEVGDWDQATALAIVQLGTPWLLTAPDAGPVRVLFGALPPDHPGAPAALVRAVLALARANPPIAQVELLRAREYLQREPGRALALRLAQVAAAVVLCRMTGDVDAAVREAASVDRAVAADHHATYAFIQCNLGAALAWAGRLDEARAILGRFAADPGHGYPGHAALGQLALIEAAAGRLHRADGYARESIAVADRAKLPVSGRTGAASAALGQVALVHDDLTAARRHLSLARQAVGARHDPSTAYAIALLRAGIAVAEQDTRTVLAAVNIARRSARRWHAPPAVVGRIELLAADVHLSRADVASARWCLDPLPDSPERTVALAQLAAVQGDPATSRRLLDQLPADATSRVRESAALLRARLAMVDGDTDSAERAVREALHHARPEQRRRRFADAGPWLRQLMQQRPGIAAAHPWLSAPFGSAADQPDGMTTEPLTERELDVLRTLTQGLSTEDIARELRLSTNTIKTHLKNIYRKLGTHRRSATARRARELSLVDYPARPPRQPP
jgi:LuxR family transcriptional regulator, maltose regulon positive regulatory protein